MFSFSCRIGNISEPYGILILWILLDYQMSPLTVLDGNQIMRICKAGKKILRTFWCSGVLAIASLSFLQLVEKKKHTHIRHPAYWDFSVLCLHPYIPGWALDCILLWACTSHPCLHVTQWSICFGWLSANKNWGKAKMANLVAVSQETCQPVMEVRDLIPRRKQARTLRLFTTFST